MLVPQVYLAPSTQQTAVQGAFLSAKQIVFKAQTLNNTSSTLLSQEGTHIEAEEITNQRGQITSQGDLPHPNADQVLILEGSDLKARGTFQLSGSCIEVKKVMETKESTTTQQEQSGLTLRVAAIGGQASQALHVASQAQSEGLTIAKGFQTMYTVGGMISNNPNRNQGVEIKDVVKSLATGQLTDALKASGLEAQVSLGTQEQCHTAHQTETRAQASCLEASKLQIHAREKDLTLSGSQLKAEEIAIEAAEDIEIRQAENTSSTTQTQAHSQAKIGLSVGTKQSQSSPTGQQSMLQADQTLRIKSGGDTRLEGVQASGKRVIAQVSGELRLTSTQDTTQEGVKSSELRIGVSILKKTRH